MIKNDINMWLWGIAEVNFHSFKTAYIFTRLKVTPHNTALNFPHHSPTVIFSI